MSNPMDLSKAIEVAAQIMFEQIDKGEDEPGWQDADPALKHKIRELVLPIVMAVVPEAISAFEQSVNPHIACRSCSCELSEDNTNVEPENSSLGVRPLGPICKKCFVEIQELNNMLQ